MDPNYAAKFEEMKKYIPFLEGMIQRLETPSSAGTNPRQAQLDKIRSLRDLLLDKKKRMKMENLQKCEQVLINLYSKVEQRDTLPGIIGPKRSLPEPPAPPDITGLDVVRTKLKTATCKDTLPEIQRLNETEEMCTPGSKEPALFQRRPNKASISPSRESRKTSTSENYQPQKTKKNYTRVLVSPEPKDRHWNADEKTERPLYSRRSPRRSPKKPSPAHPKKDKNKSSKQGSKGESKNFSITLQLPQEMNREDLESRLINCSDNDVNIDTLRVVRKQILDELKSYGVTDDISKLLFKSSKRKARKKTKKDEVEEGELSDSESEAIKNIYSSISIVDKDYEQPNEDKPLDVESAKQPHKININLVINNPDQSRLENSGGHKSTIDPSDFQMVVSKDLAKKDVTVSTISNVTGMEKNKQQPQSKETKVNKKGVQDVITIDDEDEFKSAVNTEKQKEVPKSDTKSDDDVSYVGSSTIDTDFLLETLEGKSTRVRKSFIPNFYNEQENEDSNSNATNNQHQKKDDSLPSNVVEDDGLQKSKETSQTQSENDTPNDLNKNIIPEKNNSKNIQESCQTQSGNDTPNDLNKIKTPEKKDSKNIQESCQIQSGNGMLEKEDTQKTDKNEEIPLLNTDPVVAKPSNTGAVSEIDILQALKNDILSENIAIPNVEPTPALHQPQITKVVDAKSITKRTISIEKYKQKSEATKRTPLFIKDSKSSMSKEDYAKKQSLRLTEKECERFKFPAKLAFDSSDEEDSAPTTLDDIYGGLSPKSPKNSLAPKSPENADVNSDHSTPPIIIPVEPMPAPTKEATRSDVDMRILSPPNAPTSSSTSRKEVQLEHCKNQITTEVPKKPLLADPRVRKDPRAIHLDLTPIPSHYANMTPNRTPSYASFENEKPSKKHVYAPITPTYELSLDNREKSVSREYNRDPHWEPNYDKRSEEHRSHWEPSRRHEDVHIRSTSVHRELVSDNQKSRHGYSDQFDNNSRMERHSRDNRDDYSYSRMDCPRTPVHHFGRSDCPSTPTPSFGRYESPRTPVHPFGRADCEASMTPSHPFGGEMPRTPSHPFGRSDCSTNSYGRNEMPLTPGHPFGRGEMPLTPSHPFGRGEMPLTPSHPFGRGEMPLTPSHPFGRGEMPLTPSHPFGRGEIPRTPNHPFGRSDCQPMSGPFGGPLNVPHPFGRSERPMTPNHPFGRADYSHNKSTKNVNDPRLNRNNEYDSRSKRFDRYTDRENYDRRQPASSAPLKDYHPPDRFQNVREKSIGRNEDPYDRVVHRREPSLNRTISRDTEWDQRGTSSKRDFLRDDDSSKESRDYNKYGFRKNFQRAQSIGRLENRYTEDGRKERAQSIGRNDNNTLSVESQSGRPFVIDTSVNSTFQKFLNDKGIQDFSPSFNDRRKRASSVGRYLSSEHSSESGRKDYDRPFRLEGTVAEIGKTPLIKPCSSKHNVDTSDYKKLVEFVRARSMGRDVSLAKNTPAKSFKDVKANLKSTSNVSPNHEKKGSIERIHYRDSSTRKEERKMPQGYKSSKTQKISYSPRKNSRDPRMHRERQHDQTSKNEIDNRQRKSGIVYSNDNIASGSVLSSGYGVRNYKIPKIKKVTEETDQISISNEKLSAESQSKKAKTAKNNENVPLVKEKGKKEPERENKVLSKNSQKRGTNEDRACFRRRSVSCDQKNLDDEGPKHVTSVDDSKRKTGSSSPIRSVPNEKQMDSQTTSEKFSSDVDNKKMARASSRRRSISCDQKKFEDETIPNNVTSDDVTKRMSRASSRRRSMSCDQKKFEDETVPNNVISDDVTKRMTRASSRRRSISCDQKKFEDETVPNNVTSDDVTKRMTRASSRRRSISCDQKKFKDDETIPNNVTSDDVTKRITRATSRRRSMSCDQKNMDDEIIQKNRKPRKAVIESESEDDHTSVTGRNEEKTKNRKSVTQEAVATHDQNTTEMDDDTFDCSFTMDDLESSLSQNINGDCLLANIDSLIDSLDNDLNSKTDTSENETKIPNQSSHNEKSIVINPETKETEMVAQTDITTHDETKINNEIIEKVEGTCQTCPETKESEKVKDLLHDSEVNYQDITKSSPTADIQDITKPSLTAAPTSEKHDVAVQIHDKLTSELTAKSNIKTTLTEQKTNNNPDPSKSPDLSDSNNTNVAIVTTTEIAENILDEDKIDSIHPDEVSNIERCSTPDSTINTFESIPIKSGDEIHPDSTKETSEMNSHVTSTEDPLEVTNLGSNPNPQMESLNSLISMLQDKSKIKELVTLLGNKCSETEKFRKKLEMLSEIVSDDENDAQDSKDTKGKKSEQIAVAQPQNDSWIESQKKAKEKEETVKKVENNCDPQPDNSAEVKDVKDAKLIPKKKPPLKTGKKPKKGKSLSKQQTIKNRVTRSKATKPRGKASRELKQLQESIKEMYSDDILNAPSVRNCRLAKLVDYKNNQEEDNKAPSKEISPIVVLQKFQKSEAEDQTPLKIRKKPGPKPKPKPLSKEIAKKTSPATELKNTKPGPKSKRISSDSDPYTFDTDSVSDVTITSSVERAYQNSTDSESDSLASSQSFGSSEVLADLKKKSKRKRRSGWRSGVITKRKKKAEIKQTDEADTSKDDKKLVSSDLLMPQRKISIPDKNCFTDKTYCFRKNITTYSCRLCDYTNTDIISHYKNEHPHSEIPLSRLSPNIAEKAINQSAFVDFQAISKIPTEKYICRFCLKQFKSSNSIEAFFWHVVSNHTGEYKQTCPECVNVKSCPFNLDIPPPPKKVKGQLIGYICEKCNFTQISLENLKTHVTVRHNDELTEVCTINLSDMTEKMVKTLMKRSRTIEAEEPRKLRSCNQSSTGFSDDHTDVSGSTELTSEKDTKHTSLTESDETNLSSKKCIVSKITFEEDIDSDYNDLPVKMEKNDKAHTDDTDDVDSDVHSLSTKSEHVGNSDNVFDYPHFKVHYTESGTKEYVCCVNGKDNHYKTSLLISMKKHIQSKHTETWDGYCFICKVIVTSQGEHLFKECLQHYIDKHIDNFPLLEVMQKQPVEKSPMLPEISIETIGPSKELMKESGAENVVEVPSMKIQESVADNSSEVPSTKIKNVDSLSVDPPLPSPSYPETVSVQDNASVATRLPSTVKRISATPEEIHKYEEVQANVMSSKHQVVLETMMSNESLAKIYKCAGRFCSFTSDFAEASWSHAATHQRQGGENALVCTYCDFDSKGNASDLVTHVFKAHGSCRFSCGVCFYRAAASQLVQAHIDRVHGQVWSQVKILESTTNYAVKEPVVPLSRELAVKYYTCVNDEPNCKYKTFILERFNEHMAKHEAPYKCSICSCTLPNIADLNQHLKGHGMNLYQCTWCVHGAENEESCLAHASARHPSKQPQAYVRTLRIVNSQDPTKQKVLPLAKLNKAVVTEVVKPSTNNEDPVREAERSIDLEKLIGSVATSSVVTEDAVPMDLDDDDALEVPLSPDEPETNEPSTALPTTTDEDLASRVTPILKTEPLDTSLATISKQEIISLDSDDDEPRTETPKNVIDLSDEDAPATLRRILLEPTDKVSLSSLYRCARCYMTSKTVAKFRGHINVCYLPGTTLRCAHCDFQTESKDNLFVHYDSIHGKADKRETRASGDATHMPTVNIYICGVCDYRNNALSAVKNHLKTEHKMTNLIVSSKFGSGSKDILYTVSEAPTPTRKQTPKRKLSSGNLDSPIKRIRYSLQDLDQLPVKPILDDCAYCAECEFNTKVRLNLVRHLQQHADNRHSVPNTVPLNPVPHLETNEKHFDKMVNLASSSIVVSRSEKSKTDSSPTTLEHVSPEDVSRYPKYVPDRQRLTCGARGCSYISVDQAMLKRHWEALHSGMNDYHCVHCPDSQQLDKSCPLKAGRIITHIKMHDSNLYACSTCPYYHHKRTLLEKHVTEVHNGKGKVMIVREGPPAPTPGTSPTAGAAGSMDLKPWQCGLCEYKSLLRPEVNEHCTKNHNSLKNEFKCPNCPFRATAIENVLNHKAKSHPKSKEDIIYYFYREGSIADEADGTRRWQKQRQKLGNPEPAVKTESGATAASAPLPPLGPISAPPVVDLNKVKKEFPNPETEETIEELCNKYGKFCDPNGLKFKCPLCKVVLENSKDVMQSHLFEELNYRKWACSICSYKAFHKARLHEHMFLEHRQRTAGTVELPLDSRVEKWVDNLLQHQSTIIEKNRATAPNQTVTVTEKPTPVSPILPTPEKPPAATIVDDTRLKTLEQAFGKLGTPQGVNFCCPKCDYQNKDEVAFKYHLEMELNKIRWRCSKCSTASQTYHEAQLHCKTCTSEPGFASPVEAVRDPELRSSWLNTSIRVQKRAMNIVEDSAQETISDDMINIPGPLDNSLLVVRYEERVPTPEEEMLVRGKKSTPVLQSFPSTSNPATVLAATSPESDDERLVIDEVSKTREPKKRKATHKCNFCDFTSKSAAVEAHMFRHFNMQPFSCNYCSYTCTISQKSNHTTKCHPGKAISFTKNVLPSGPPRVSVVSLKGRRKSIAMDRPESPPGMSVVSSKGRRKSVAMDRPKSLTVEDKSDKKEDSPKKDNDQTDNIVCGYCNMRFSILNDMQEHHNSSHYSLQIKYHQPKPSANDKQGLTDESDIFSPNLDESTSFKRIAKKSTTKPPFQTVAKKSTAKLPYFAWDEESESGITGKEYSFYGTRSDEVDKETE